MLICVLSISIISMAWVSCFAALRRVASVVALSNSSGTTIQTYEYTVYGEVAAEDPNHPNPYLFTGRRFDRETGLYYYRARYYNPYIGRFLQTDPVGYGEGMNLYLYCMNNPLNLVDPSGACCDPCEANESNDTLGQLIVRLRKAMHAELFRYDDEINWWYLMGYTDSSGLITAKWPYFKRKVKDPNEWKDCEGKKYCVKLLGVFYCPTQSEVLKCETCCDYMANVLAKPPLFPIRERFKWWLQRTPRLRDCYVGCGVNRKPIY